LRRFIFGPKKYLGQYRFEQEIGILTQSSPYYNMYDRSGYQTNQDSGIKWTEGTKKIKHY